MAFFERRSPKICDAKEVDSHDLILDSFGITESGFETQFSRHGFLSFRRRLTSGGLISTTSPRDPLRKRKKNKRSRDHSGGVPPHASGGNTLHGPNGPAPIHSSLAPMATQSSGLQRVQLGADASKPHHPQPSHGGPFGSDDTGVVSSASRLPGFHSTPR